ncbi:MAG: class I SAM-dependent methyltransferase [Rhodobacteraceae bacterium]|nr:class I SAM-dependent methyltransferase [Paracoccaceae bacterium]
MAEDVSFETASSRTGWQSPLGYLARSVLRRLSHLTHEGSLRVELPSGEEVLFGTGTDTRIPTIQVHHYRAFWKIVRRGAIGFSEAYMDGDIDADDLVGFFEYFLKNRTQFEEKTPGFVKSGFMDRILHLARRNSKRGSRRNITEHYDLGNAFYRLWLDEKMIYSSACYGPGAETLEDAQKVKLQKITDLVKLTGQEKILEIGCGWGALALHIAAQSGARVEGITLSDEQLAYARDAAREAGLSDRCSFVLKDYRDQEGAYDRIVSIEMIEAVGEAYWPDYFKVLHDRLKDGGSAVIQAITIDEARYESYRNSAEFIQRYIFPGGMLPTREIMEEQAVKAGLRTDHVELFGQSYAQTLMDWRERFEDAWPEIAKLGFDEHFRRRWRYYLAYCEAGFRDGSIDVGFYRFVKDQRSG